MSLPSNEGPSSPSSTATPTTEIPESPHDHKQSPDIIIDWDGPQDPDNPKKSVHDYSWHGADNIFCPCSWPSRRKWAATFVVSSFAFMSAVTSSMVALATFQVASDLGARSNIVIAMMTSIFVAGYGQLLGSEQRTSSSNPKSFIFEPWIDHTYIGFGPLVSSLHHFSTPTLMLILNPRFWDR